MDNISLPIVMEYRRGGFISGTRNLKEIVMEIKFSIDDMLDAEFDKVLSEFGLSKADYEEMSIEELGD